MRNLFDEESFETSLEVNDFEVPNEYEDEHLDTGSEFDDTLELFDEYFDTDETYSEFEDERFHPELADEDWAEEISKQQ